MNGPKPKTPVRGKNGPGDKGRSDGVRHGAHPSMPKVGKGLMTQTKDPSKKGSK